jgi:hypothetical protein
MSIPNVSPQTVHPGIKNIFELTDAAAFRSLWPRALSASAYRKNRRMYAVETARLTRVTSSP